MISPAQPSVAGKPSDWPAVEPRRGVLFKILAVLLGAAAYVPPVALGVASFLNPLRQKRQAGQFMRLAALDALPADGAPLKTTVTMDRVDAWNRLLNQPVGAVFLQRVGPKEVRAIHVVCPHAGCFVTYEAKENIFFCPCHTGRFELSGKRKDTTSPSPRDLDSLQVEIRGSEVWVKFESFQTNTPKKTPLA